MAERRYNEKELATILRRAAEAQAEGSVQANDNAGFTQAEIERLAAEVGIDAKHIAGAVESLGNNPEHVGLLKQSTRTRPVLERTIDGTLDDFAWEEVVAELRLVYGSAGTVSEVGSSREWAGGTEFTTAHLSATPRNGKTRLRLTLHQEGPVIIGCLLTVMASVFGSMAVGIPLGKAGVAGPLVLAAILGLLLTVATIANLSVASINRKNLKKADEVLARIKKMVSADSLESRLANAPIPEDQTESQSTNVD